MKSETAPFNVMLSSIYCVWYRNFLEFKKSWIISVVWTVFEPILFLTGIGFGLGAFISKVEGSTYSEFYFPGLLAVSSMMVSFFASTYDAFSKLSYQKIYQTQILSPLQPKDIVLGEILWGATKGVMSSFGVAIIAGFLGLITQPTFVLSFIFIFLSCALFSSLGILVTTFVRNYDQIIIPTSGLIIPMSIFCGTYFPIEHLPWLFKYIIYVMPLSQTTIAVRQLAIGNLEPNLLIHLLYLVIVTAVLIHLAIRRMTKKLLN